MSYMPFNDAPCANLATAFVTINGNRLKMLMAKNFEATASIETKDVARLGTVIKSKKTTGMSLKFKMTIYKCTEAFDDLVEQYKNTGLAPVFEIQVTSSDPATSMGRSTKVYTGCTLDGDILLSKFDAEGDFIEQEINGYCENYTSPEKYTEPSYM